jgi:hypothetical protein
MAPAFPEVAPQSRLGVSERSSEHIERRELTGEKISKSSHVATTVREVQVDTKTIQVNLHCSKQNTIARPLSLIVKGIQTKQLIQSLHVPPHTSSFYLQSENTRQTRRSPNAQILHNPLIARRARTVRSRRTRRTRRRRTDAHRLIHNALNL